MQQFFEFVIRHWDLWLAFAILTGLLIYTEASADKVAGTELLSLTEATALMNHEAAKVVDIRQSSEFLEGHILGSLNVSPDDLDASLKTLQKLKEKPLIISCNSGQRAARFGATLRQHQFSRVYALKGGVSAWKEAKLPLVRE